MKDREKGADHVRLIPPNVAFCAHCGLKYAIAMPVSFNMLGAIGRQFDKEHRECVVGSKGVACTHCMTFGHEEEKCQGVIYGGDPYAWMNGPDVGQSSKTIWHRMMGTASYEVYDPLDWADFGRCHRLLHAIPGWRARIGEMSAVSRDWRKLVERWDAIETAYLDELRSGVFEKTNALIEDACAVTP